MRYPLNVRERSDGDLRQLAAMLVEVYATDGYPVEGVQDPYSWLEIPSAYRIFTALFDGKVSGHIALTRPPDDKATATVSQMIGGNMNQLAAVQRLFVAPQRRRHGLGRLLMEAVQQEAELLQLTPMLEVMYKDSEAIRLYRKMGWTEVGSISYATPNGDVPALIYVRDLRNANVIAD